MDENNSINSLCIPVQQRWEINLQMPGLTRKHTNIKLYKADSGNLFPTGSPEQTKKKARGCGSQSHSFLIRGSSREAVWGGGIRMQKEKEKRDGKANSKAMGSPSFVTSHRCETQPS